MPKENPLTQFKNKIRIRVCGILEKEGRILMIKHHGLDIKDVWLPPGGGINFEESIESALIREFKEETNLTVTLSGFIGVNEYIKNGFHAIELFYNVNYEYGDLKLGKDPELSFNNQIIKELKYITKIDAQKDISIPL